jgi:hypothetical protein
MHVYQTKFGDCTVLQNEFGSKREEYGLVSLIKKYQQPVFAQLVGEASPKPFLSKEYEVTAMKIGKRNSLFTVWHRPSFNYQLPFPKKEERYILAPTKEGAIEMLKQLTGIYDLPSVQRHFNYYEVKDACKASNRIALVVKQRSEGFNLAKGTEQEATVMEFLELKRNPRIFKGGVTNAFGD